MINVILFLLPAQAVVWIAILRLWELWEEARWHPRKLELSDLLAHRVFQETKERVCDFPAERPRFEKHNASPPLLIRVYAFPSQTPRYAQGREYLNLAAPIRRIY